MTLWLVVFRSLRQHALSTIVTALSIALGGGLLMSVWAVKTQSSAVFTGVNGGFDAVLGARGAKLQLVLNAIFHLEASPGNIEWSDYQEIKNNPNVDLAVPIAVGDNYHGYRLVGTLPELFERAEYAPGRHYEFQPGGRIFDPTLREAVVGSFVAQKMNLNRGDVFHPYHGLIYNEKDQHSETYVVVGILMPSNTPADRVIWIPLEGIQRMTGHNPDNVTEVSAVLVKLKEGAAAAGFRLNTMYNKEGKRLTFAWPIGQVMVELFNKIGWVDSVLELVSYLVALVTSASILASIYNSMNERRREIAILRALGARRRTIFGAILLEAASISALGMAIAFLFYAIIMIVAAHIIRAQTGVVIEPMKFNQVMFWAPVALITLGALAGIVPALKAYRTDVAEYLSPSS
ncbi:MAG TPA: FtsX-like permease family protein [Verrucomicrobiae bacterium]|nr:FtsX-like permease family protein [Verrucomicrobiae bacterium]